MIQGKQREGSNFSKKCGMFEARPISFNPNKQELEKILGVEIEKEPEYVTTEKDKNGQEFKRARISVWMEDVTSKQVFPLRFTVDDREYISERTGKTQYINNIGTTSWAIDQDDLPDWFRARDYRVAKVGEEGLYKFLKNWLSDLDYRDFNTVVELDMKKMFNNNVKELRDVSVDFAANTITCLATVRLATVNGEAKEYQSVYNKEFLPGNCMKYFRVQGKRTPDIVTKFINRVSDKEFGCKDVYVLDELTDYSTDMSVVANDRVISEEDSDY
jgi:hypothetical protein